MLALAFVVLTAAVTSALLASLTSAVNERGTLDQVRDRQYAADGAVQQAIATVRAVAAPGPGLAACGGPYTHTLNAVAIRVDCTNVPTLTRTGFVQRNVVFTSCVDTGVACTAARTIVRAQVNYQAADAETPAVTKTWIQSWTVTR